MPSPTVTAWLEALGLEDDLDTVGDVGRDGAAAWISQSVFFCPDPAERGGGAAAAAQAVSHLARDGGPRRVYLLLPSDTATTHYHDLILAHATILGFSRFRVSGSRGRRPTLLAVLERREARAAIPAIRTLHV